MFYQISLLVSFETAHFKFATIFGRSSMSACNVPFQVSQMFKFSVTAFLSASIRFLTMLVSDVLPQIFQSDCFIFTIIKTAKIFSFVTFLYVRFQLFRVFKICIAFIFVARHNSRRICSLDYRVFLLDMSFCVPLKLLFCSL